MDWTIGVYILLIGCLAGISSGSRYLSDDDFEELYLDYLLEKEESDEAPSELKSNDNVGSTPKMTIKMPGVTPKKHDSYICTSLKMPKDDTYIVGFEPTAEMNTAHHMLMFGCETPFSTGATWNCGEMSPVCANGGQRIMYAWGRNAPKLALPKGVGFKAGGDTGVKYLVLQVHYGNVDKFAGGKLKDYSGVVLKTTMERQRYQAGIYLLAGGWSSIPPHKQKTHIDASCEFVDRMTIYPFAFRVHAHKLGDVISGYRIRNGKWTLIGKGDPQRPQAFYPIKNKLDITWDDDLVAQCTYNSMTRDTVTQIGPTMKDEMCNFYIMYFYDQDKYDVSPPTTCGNVGSYENVLFGSFPHGSDIPLPGGHPKMEMKMPMGKRGSVAKGTSAPTYSLVNNLLTNYKDLSQINQACAVDVTANQKEVVVLHRGGRAWDMNSFDEDNVFNPLLGKIKQNTLLWIDIASGRIEKTWGKNLFYLPHGLTIDDKNNIWITDVGSHQVFKFGSKLDPKPLLVLGEELMPGSDNSHFCKPTDVAVDPSGKFYVADGYCNQRIVVFSGKGVVIATISPSTISGLPSPHNFAVPHSVTLDPVKSILWVADRENHRVLQFDATTLALTKEFASLDNAVYAVAFSTGGAGGLVHMVTYPNTRRDYSKGLTYGASSATLVTSWRANQGFEKPHDLATTKGGLDLFVVELDPPKLWHFKKDN